MLLKTEMKDVTLSQLQYKVGAMKKEYDEAVKWEGKTGQGVDNGSVKGNYWRMIKRIYV